MKTKIIFLLPLMFFFGKIFSQTKEIDFPYMFTVNHNQFRINQIHVEANDTTNSYNFYVVEKYNSVWRKIDTIGNNYGNYRPVCFSCVNKDSFPDIVFPEKWDNAEVHIFNPIKNIFVSSGNFFLNQDTLVDNRISIKQIDTINNLYCDYRRGFLNTNYSSRSYLFRIKNYKRENIAYMDIERPYSEKIDDYIVEDVLIYDATNDDVYAKPIKTIKINSKEDLIKSNNEIYSTEFDFETYWKNNWQKFLPQKN